MVSGVASTSTHSWSQDRGSFIGRSPSELAQEAEIVLEEQPDLGDAVARHGDALEAHAEGEAGDFFRVVAHGPEHVGMDHAGSQQLAPARPGAHRTARLAITLLDPPGSIAD